MYNLADYWHRLLSIARYYYRARTIYDAHSPFLYELLRATLEDNRSYFAFEQAESLRRYWSHQRTQVPVIEAGAGSKVYRTSQVSARRLVRASALSPSAGRLLFRLAHLLKPRYLIELGTNVGVSTVYLHGANRSAELHTVEGNPPTAEMAHHSFRMAGTSEALHVHTGTFDHHLPKLLESLPRLDFLFLDGDHRHQPTVQYVRQSLPKLHGNSVVVIGDIHWSTDMEAAWRELQALPAVRLSVDLYELGLLFFRPEIKEPQHWTIIGKHWKPWRMAGLI